MQRVGVLYEVSCVCLVGAGAEWFSRARARGVDPLPRAGWQGIALRVVRDEECVHHDACLGDARGLVLEQVPAVGLEGSLERGGAVQEPGGGVVDDNVHV